MKALLTDASFLCSIDRIIRPDYQPSTLDIVRAPERLCTLKETQLAVENLNVTLIEVPHSKLGRVLHQFDHVDACLMT